MNIGEPFGVEIGPDRALYITEVKHHRVRRLDMTKNELTTVAGTGQPGYSGDGGPAMEAKFNGPKGIAVLAHRHLLITDAGNNVIRHFDLQSGLIETVAGHTLNVEAPVNHRDIDFPELNQPHGVCVAADGAFFIGDTLNHRVLRVRHPSLSSR
jgi:streptogramin lyase